MKQDTINALPDELRVAMKWLRFGGYDLCATAENPTLKKFWYMASRAYHSSAAYREGTDDIRRGYREFEYMADLLFKLQGGDLQGLQKVNMKDKARRRKGIARQIHKLRELIQSDNKGDAAIDNLTIPSLVVIAAQYLTTDAATCVDKQPSVLSMPHDIARITFSELLAALEDRLGTFEPLTACDPVEQAVGVPQARRSDRERIWLERSLTDYFKRFTGEPQSGLVAEALNFILQLPPDKIVSANEVGKRLASRPR